MSGETIKDADGFEYPSYDKNLDYRSMVYTHRVAGDWSSYKNETNDVDRMFKQLEQLFKKYPDQNYQWYRQAVFDRKLEWKKKQQMAFFHIPKQKPTDEKVWLFVTVNLNDSKLLETEYPSAMKNIVDSILASQDKALKCYQMRMVIEKHREAGIHHHIHILMEGTEKQAPSYIVQRLFRLTAIKQVVDKPTFIDVKTSWAKKFEHKSATLTTCINYIEGNKGTEAKRSNVEKDKLWRIENALEHEYKNI